MIVQAAALTCMDGDTRKARCEAQTARSQIMKAPSPDPGHHLRRDVPTDSRATFAGHVNMDALSDTARDNYLYARAVVGREFSIPTVIVASAY